MPRLLTLSRAARLVGVRRGALQRKIQSGELVTFEGMLSVEDLLRVYPELRLEDDTVLENLERLKERATAKPIQDRLILPSHDILAARIAVLGEELARANVELSDYRSLVAQLQDRLDEWAGTGNASERTVAGSLRRWLAEHPQTGGGPTGAARKLLAQDSVLRLVAAQVRVRPGNDEFFVDGAETLLEAALRAGLAIDYGCSDGSCGRCRARVISGRSKAVRPSAVEQVEPNVLMCCHTSLTDLEIEVAQAAGVEAIPRQHITGVVKELDANHAGVLLLRVQMPPAARLRFLAGQRATLVAGNECVGTCSIANCPCEDRTLQFHLAPGVDPDRLRPGSSIVIVGPDGEFVLDRNSLRSIVFVAWGTGFAPIKALLEQALALDQAETLHLYWLAAEGGHYLHNLCRSWTDALDNFQYTPLHASGTVACGSDNDLLSLAEQILHDHPDTGDWDCYVAGPDWFVGALAQLLQQRGVLNARCHSEYITISGIRLD